jgi:hypothetical protein
MFTHPNRIKMEKCLTHASSYAMWPVDDDTRNIASELMTMSRVERLTESRRTSRSSKTKQEGMHVSQVIAQVPRGV